MLDQLPSDVDESTVNALKTDPRLWVQNAWSHPTRTGDNYDFRTTDEELLEHLVDDDSFLNPDNWGDINVLLMARGEGKTTATNMILNWAHDCYPQLDSYMTAPSKGQVYNYTERFEAKVRESGLVNRRREGANNKSHQGFEVQRVGENGTNDVIQGDFKADSGYGEGDSLRGPHSQLGVIDETQDLTKAAFNTYLPCIDMGLPSVPWFPTIFMIGTPKEEGSFYHDLWERSDQKTWDADEGEWVQQSTVDEYSVAPDAAEELGIDPDEVDSKEVRGWHIDWMNSPMHDDGDVLQAKNEMTEMKFVNEVKAQFYEPEDNLLNVTQVRNCFDSDLSFENRRVAEESTVVMGVDWGGGKDKNAADTVFAVVEHTIFEDYADSTLLNIDFLDDDLTKVEQIRKVEDWLQQYDVDRCVIDYGYGNQAMESLQDGYDTRVEDGYEDIVTAAKYGHVKNKADIKFEQNSGKERFFTCDKTRSVSRLVDWIRDEELTIPYDSMDSQTEQKLLSQLTAPYKTLKETPTGQKNVRIEKGESKQDDALDALTFCWLAIHELDDDDYYIGFSGKERAT